MDLSLAVEEWYPQHPRWSELEQVVEVLEQSSWAQATFDWHYSSHMLVAQAEEEIAGFLRFAVQPIGVEEDHEPVMLNGQELTEAKVLAFGIAPGYRRQGIGRQLQAHLLLTAIELGCYQVRSHSGGAYRANHQLKLMMGFGVQPIIRGDDRKGVYFIMPLRASLPPGATGGTKPC